MEFEEGVKLDFQDVLIKPKRSTLRSRKDVSLEREFKFLHSKKTWKGIPIVASNMDASGTFEIAKVLAKYKMLTCLNKFYSIEELRDFFKNFNKPNYVSYTTGIKNKDFSKLEEILSIGLGKKFNFVCLDVANGYLEVFVDKLKELRKICPKHTIIAGSVATDDMTKELILMGADIVKIGIGSGSACTTRTMTGVGYPQLSAIMECKDSAHGTTFRKERTYGLIMSDGGARSPGCVAKAFCAGADFLMSGYLFSGYDQSGGELVEREINGEMKKFKQYYGMASEEAMKKHGKIEDYRTSEGRNLEIPYKGDVNNFIKDLLGGLRSTATLIGARSLKEFPKRCTFLRVNHQLNDFLESYEA